MRKRLRHFLFGIFWAAAASSTEPTELAIASWNLEWLVSQETAHIARQTCDAGQRSPLPCDVARELSRDSADLARLAHYARKLDADVIAFQEVENAQAARRVFRDHDICISKGKGAQNTGFAVRTGMAFRCEPPLRALALGDRQRAGARLTLYPGTAQQVELLAVHLKSGCSRDPLDAGSTACRTLAAQGAVLGAWMRKRAAIGARVIVLGDFNRVGPVQADPFWDRLQVGTAHDAEYVNASTGVAFRNCYRGQPYMQYIDHILVSRNLATQLKADSFRHSGYRSLDAFRYRLSDHCPIRVSLIRDNINRVD